jgi:hypothetical protein
MRDALRAEAKRLRRAARLYLRGDGPWIWVTGLRRSIAHGRRLLERARQADALADQCAADAKRELPIIRACSVLGLPRHFSREDLRVAYRALAFAAHPDRQPYRRRKSATRALARINSANQVLCRLFTASEAA